MCAALGCNHNVEDCFLYPFPRNEHDKMVWMSNLKTMEKFDGGQHHFMLNGLFACFHHFKPEHFYLKEMASPSVNLGSWGNRNIQQTVRRFSK